MKEKEDDKDEVFWEIIRITTQEDKISKQKKSNKVSSLDASSDGR